MQNNNIKQSNEATLYIRYFLVGSLLKIILYDNNKKIIFSSSVSNIWHHEKENEDIIELAKKIVNSLLDKKIKSIKVYIRGNCASANTIVNIIRENKIQVLWIKDMTPIVHNGFFIPKKYKKRI